MTLPGVEDSWHRMTNWFGQHATAVPSILRGPASETDLARASDAVGVALPADLLAWWRLVDGVTEESRMDDPILPSLYHPWSVDGALYSRDQWLQVATDGADTARQDGRPAPAEQPAGTPTGYGWAPQWLPIANDCFGSDLFVDLRPGPLHGCLMEWDHDEGPIREPLWPGVQAMLAEVADALESGALMPGLDVRVQADGEHMQWVGPDCR
jgi:cell wall assembly regulator SMI1